MDIYLRSYKCKFNTKMTNPTVHIFIVKNDEIIIRTDLSLKGIKNNIKIVVFLLLYSYRTSKSVIDPKKYYHVLDSVC